MGHDLYELANALAVLMVHVEEGDIEEAQKAAPRVMEAMHQFYRKTEGFGGVIDDRPSRP